jgi:hydroxymethylbilane synthase
VTIVNFSRPTICLASRSSRLALWQAEHVAALLRAVVPGVAVKIVHVTTLGDRDQTGALRSFGGLGVFTSEVQRAVLDGQADLAVHSLKDLPTESASGLCLGAVPEREDTADVLLLPARSQPLKSLEELPRSIRLGTGSLRRQAQIRYVRPDLQIGDLRGNVETRIRKLDEGEYDTILLALAGLKRLGLDDRVSLVLGPPQMFAAVGQGALGIECRQDDDDLLGVLAYLDHRATRRRVTAEREMLSRLRAGCHAPVGVASNVDGNEIMLEAVVLDPAGTERLAAQSRGADAIELGRDVAELLLKQGAERLIAAPR